METASAQFNGARGRLDAAGGLRYTEGFTTTATASRQRETPPPMTTFDDRKESFERKFAHDEELRFKAMARRNKLLGLWAAEKLGKSGAEAQDYAKAVVLADFEEAGDGDVLRKVRGDLEGAGISLTDAQLRVTMEDLMVRAIEEIRTGR